MESNIFRLVKIETTMPLDGTLGKVDYVISYIGALEFKGLSK